jgi:2,3-bisphosphoglycerate-independent phosphoglycerate mutase
MKTVVILGDGMSDHPVKALGGKTPLMVAKKPHIDEIARRGVTGLFSTIPPGQPNGSAVANLSVLGYDPAETFSGRGVLEAASIGVELGKNDVAMRCNLLCIDEQGRIKNHSAGHISSEEAGELIAELDRQLGNAQGDKPVKFHTGTSFRNLLVLPGNWASADFDCTPPHDFVGGLETELMPKALNEAAEETVAVMIDLYWKAREILNNHPINKARVAAGKDAANAIWVWSPGVRPKMKSFKELYGKSGAVISAVDLIQGLGILAGMEKIEVEGATGLYNTNYEGKAAAALEALERHDFVYVHVEATDEAGHERDLDLKIKCIEYLDERLVKPIMEGIESRGIEAIIAILPDHPTPVETGAHSSDPVPVAIWEPGTKADEVSSYDEEAVRNGSLGTMVGNQFIRQALKV